MEQIIWCTKSSINQFSVGNDSRPVEFLHEELKPGQVNFWTELSGWAKRHRDL